MMNKRVVCFQFYLKYNGQPLTNRDWPLYFLEECFITDLM